MKSFVKLKVLVVFFILVFMFTGAAFAQEEKNTRSKDAWILLGYSYTVPSDSKVDGLMGPATLTFGGDIWRFIGLEVTLGTKWKVGGKVTRTHNVDLYTSIDSLWSFDIKPYLLLQPKFGIDLISIRPYFGIGPTFSFSSMSSIDNSIKVDTSFDVGFSTKLGVRLQALKFLFVGVGAEYMYHNPKLSGVNQNLSGFSFGGEVGIIW